MIKTVIFDCDGVLADTENLKYFAWRNVLKQYGIKYTLAEYLKVVGKSHFEIIKTIPVEKKYHENIILAKEYEYVTNQQEKFKPIKHGINFLRKCFVARLNIGLATSDSFENTMVKLIKLNIVPYFNHIITADDLSLIKDSTGVNKPKPYIYQMACFRLKAFPEECVVIEDSEVGVMAGHLAGCNVVAVPNRFTKNQNFTLAKTRLKSLNVSLDHILK